VATVAAQGRTIAAVRDVNAVLGDAAVTFVVFNQEIVGEPGEKAPSRVVAEDAVADGDVVAALHAQRSSSGVERVETIHDDVGTVLDVKEEIVPARTRSATPSLRRIPGRIAPAGPRKANVVREVSGVSSGLISTTVPPCCNASNGSEAAG